jgi:hypothetical protein
MRIVAASQTSPAHPQSERLRASSFQDYPKRFCCCCATTIGVDLPIRWTAIAAVPPLVFFHHIYASSGWFAALIGVLNNYPQR